MLNEVVFMKTFDNDFDEIIITFTDQNVRPLEMEGKVNLALLRDAMIFYRTKTKKIC